ncbi:MAG: hypothetical protein QME68_08810, partial [Elusimicrobiota bacterium]|nr:hypothetical protein [Elusimicrobiota bacterium]
MGLSNDGTNYSWQPYSTSMLWTLVSGDGIKTVYFKVKDKALNVGGPITGTIILDTTSLFITINSGENRTNTPHVTLAISAPNPYRYEMRFSNDNSNYSDWEPYEPLKSWTLTSGDGVKIVYVQVRDFNFNLIGPVSDSIVLDTKNLSLVINNGSSHTNSHTVMLYFCGTPPSNASFAGVGFSNDNVTYEWYNYSNTSSPKQWNLTLGDGIKTVYFKLNYTVPEVVDEGPLGMPILRFVNKTLGTTAAVIILDTTPPSNLSLKINDNANFTNSQYVTLSISASDANLYWMCFSNDGNAYSAWETFSTSKTWILSPKDDTKTVYFKVRDGALNVAGPINATIILDMLP